MKKIVLVLMLQASLYNAAVAATPAPTLYERVMGKSTKKPAKKRYSETPTTMPQRVKAYLASPKGALPLWAMGAAVGLAGIKPQTPFERLASIDRATLATLFATTDRTILTNILCALSGMYGAKSLLDATWNSITPPKNQYSKRAEPRAPHIHNLIFLAALQALPFYVLRTKNNTN